MTRRTALAALLVALASTTPACSGGEGMVLIGGNKVDAATIDRDPSSLLPSGIVILGYLDAATLFTSSLGPDVSRAVAAILPLGPESNFDSKRDVTRVYAGVYAMQGADFCAVVQGNFDVDAIKRAADARAVTIGGAPMVKSRYAETDMYTAGNLGFVVLTSHTALTGNETGMRRALDRLRFGKLERAIPGWMVDLVNTQGASFAVAGDLSQQQAVDAASKTMPFLSGLRTIRAIGNFKAPGLNVAGALTYPDNATANQAAASLQHLQQMAQIVNLFTSFGGINIPQIQTQVREGDVAFTTSVNEGTMRVLLSGLTELAKKAVAPSAH